MTNIYEKLQAIQGEIPRLKKDGDLELGGRVTKFLQVDAILDAAKPLFKKHKVVVVPSLVEAITDTYTAQEPDLSVAPDKWSGRIAKFQIREKVIYDFAFIDSENPESQVVARVSGEAMDTQDKASGKAFTSAFKSALIKTLMIVTGDPEIEDSNQDTDTMREPAGPSAATQKIQKARGVDPVKAAPVTTAPTTTVPTTTQVDTDDDSKGILRTRLRELQGEHSLTMAQVNFIGEQVTEQPRAKWFTQVRLLMKLVDALEDASERERLLALSATGEVK